MWRESNCGRVLLRQRGAKEILGAGQVDVVVHGEGEVTIVELVQVLRENSASGMRNVAGISFRGGEEVFALLRGN